MPKYEVMGTRSTDEEMFVEEIEFSSMEAAEKHYRETITLNSRDFGRPNYRRFQVHIIDKSGRVPTKHIEIEQDLA